MTRPPDVKKSAEPHDEKLLPLGNADHLFEQLLTGTGLTDAPNKSIRRPAEVIDAGFKSSGNADAFMASSVMVRA